MEISGVILRDVQSSLGVRGDIRGHVPKSRESIETSNTANLKSPHTLSSSWKITLVNNVSHMPEYEQNNMLGFPVRNISYCRDTYCV